MMAFKRQCSRKTLILIAVFFVFVFILYIGAVAVVPGKITLLQGEDYAYDFKSPFLIGVKADRDDVIKLYSNDMKKSDSYINLSNQLHFKTQKLGSVNLKMKIFGLIPVKTVQVDIVPNNKVVACGNTIGVKLTIDGILVIGLSDVETVDGKKLLPAKDVGIKTGDILMEINREKLDGTENLIRQIENSRGEKLKLRIRRDSSIIETEIKPVKAADDKKYHIGLWVRDSTAGIGTLTFYDPVTKSFGALGHGITDIDTGTLMPVSEGEILESNILAVKKGQPGNPGELKGVFIEDKNKLGIIQKNCNYGIYGTLREDAINRINSKQYPVALRSQVKEGNASILANIDGKSVEEFSVEIQKVSRQNLSSTKGMIIKITDKRLLNATGGIVQGMSGSPILQDGRLVGAVTHVLVNDPTRGYGIFIEGMLKNLISENPQNKEKAG